CCTTPNRKTSHGTTEPQTPGSSHTPSTRLSNTAAADLPTPSLARTPPRPALRRSGAGARGSGPWTTGLAGPLRLRYVRAMARRPDQLARFAEEIVQPRG